MRTFPGATRPMRFFHFTLALVAAALAACSTVSEPRLPPGSPPLALAAERLRIARKTTLDPEKRAAYYLSAAATTAPLLTAEPARTIYNDATAELTDLLRDTGDGKLWNRPLTLADGQTFRLRFQPGAPGGTWSPREFTGFQPASQVRRRHLRQDFVQPGVGGTLVGVQRVDGSDARQRARFEPKRGFVAPVTATLDFRGSDATLTLHDPTLRRTARVNGRTFPLAADLTAPIASIPVRNELINGVLGMIRVEKYLSNTGLYLVRPYDASRTLVVLVHGLASTPQMWANVINEVEADPDLRGRFQFAAFQYPTGNPLLYSAMRCREELTRFRQRHPGARVILVGHSMGGLVCRLQVVDVQRTLWDASFKRRADALYARVPADSVVGRSYLFSPDPQVRRLVFICVPHRGSELALGSIGVIGMRLITLPATLVTEFTRTLGDALETVGGKPQIPTSINSLSPKSPTLLALDPLPILVPHHSIIGDRGRGDTPHSSDGVVAYSSSHLASAQTELIVPGPHGSHELPQTVEELKRILRLQLGAPARAASRKAAAR